MTELDFKDLQRFNANLKRLLASIEVAHVLAETMPQRMAAHKEKYPNMDDAKIEELFHEELRDYILKVRGDYDSMMMNAITINIGFPFSLDEIFTYINNSTK